MEYHENTIGNNIYSFGYLANNPVNIKLSGCAGVYLRHADMVHKNFNKGGKMEIKWFETAKILPNEKQVVLGFYGWDGNDPKVELVFFESFESYGKCARKIWWEKFRESSGYECTASEPLMWASINTLCEKIILGEKKC